MTNLKQIRRDGGFTLIELIIVIVILGILAAIAAPRFGSIETDAKIAVAKGGVGALSSAAVVAFAANKVANGGKATFASIKSGATLDSNITATAAADCSASAVTVSYVGLTTTGTQTVSLTDFCSGT